jgi:amino acid transporter
VIFQVLTQASWETVSITFQFSLLNGGPASMVYGGILAGFGATAVAMSLAEMASMYARPQVLLDAAAHLS